MQTWDLQMVIETDKGKQFQAFQEHPALETYCLEVSVTVEL